MMRNLKKTELDKVLLEKERSTEKAQKRNELLEKELQEVLDSQDTRTRLETPKQHTKSGKIAKKISRRRKSDRKGEESRKEEKSNDYVDVKDQPVNAQQRNDQLIREIRHKIRIENLEKEEDLENIKKENEQLNEELHKKEVLPENEHLHDDLDYLPEIDKKENHMNDDGLEHEEFRKKEIPALPENENLDHENEKQEEILLLKDKEENRGPYPVKSIYQLVKEAHERMLED